MSELQIWFQPVLGEPFTVSSTEFETVEAALGELRQALHDGTSMVFAGLHSDLHTGQADTAPTVVNFKHVLALRVWERDRDDESSQYL